MELLARRFTPISVTQLLDWFSRKVKPAANGVLVTFDDGYRNNLTHAAPVLYELGIPAVFHVATGYIGHKRILWHNEIYRRVMYWPKANIPMPDGIPDKILSSDLRERRLLANSLRQYTKKMSHDSSRQYLTRLREYDLPVLKESEQEMFAFLSWDDVRELHRKGFEIGSHTVEHPMLTRLEPSQLDRELRESKSTIEEEVGVACRCIAYPNGTPCDYSDAVVQGARRAGYKVGLTTLSQFCAATDHQLQLGRVCITGDLGRHAFYSNISGVSSSLRRVRSLLVKRADERDSISPAFARANKN